MTAAYLQWIPNFLFWSLPSQGEQLKSALDSYTLPNSTQSPSNNLLHKAVVYLADHSDSKLEAVVKKKLTEAEPEQRKIALRELGTSAHQSENNRMLKVCKRIVDLNLLKTTFGVPNVPELAALEATYTPKPARLIEVISNPLLHKWKRHRHYLGKLLNLVVAVPMGTLTTTTTSVLALLHTPPSNIMEVQGYLYFYINFYEGYKKGKQYLLGYFGSMEKVYTIAAAILVTLLALNYVKNWLRLGLSDHISICENLNLKVKSGLIGPSVGRIDERKKLDNCWAKSIDQKYRIAMIVGPTGCGKTQMIEGIAWEAENDPASPYYGKKVYQINTADLLNHKPYLLDLLLLEIKGHEDDAILFFDEAHSAAVSQGKIGSLLQLFKTKLPQNVRIGLATTKAEYDQYIKPDVAFTDRVEEVPMESLPDADTRAVVKNSVRQDDGQILEVHESAYDAILKVAATDPAYAKRVNPRKSIQLTQKLSSSVFQWTPSLLSQQLKLALREERTTVDKMGEASNNDQNWSTSDIGKQAVADLKAQRTSIKKLRERLIAQQQQLDKIRHLQKLQMTYRKEKNELIHMLAANPQNQEKAEKNFLMLKFMLLPQIQQVLQNEATSFEKEYQEKVPLVLDAEWIKSQFPACFPATKLA